MRTLEKLMNIARRAKAEPKTRFTSLAHLVDGEMLRWSHSRLKRNRAVGVDGVGVEAYGANLGANVDALVGRLKDKSWPVTLPVADTVVEASSELVEVMPTVTKLPPVMLPVALKLLPVAAPMLGVVRFALALTMMLPLPSNAVVSWSTLALNTVPDRLKPAEVLAVYCPAPEN